MCIIIIRQNGAIQLHFKEKGLNIKFGLIILLIKYVNLRAKIIRQAYWLIRIVAVAT